jgi:hypothetical protein
MRSEVSGGGDASLLALASAWSWIEARLMGSPMTIANFDMSQAQRQFGARERATSIRRNDPALKAATLL